MLKFWAEEHGKGEARMGQVTILDDGYAVRVNKAFNARMKRFLGRVKAKIRDGDISD